MAYAYILYNTASKSSGTTCISVVVFFSRFILCVYVHVLKLNCYSVSTKINFVFIFNAECIVQPDIVMLTSPSN